MSSKQQKGDVSTSTSGRRRIRWPWKRRKKNDAPSSPPKPTNGQAGMEQTNFSLTAALHEGQPGVSYAAAMAAAYDHKTVTAELHDEPSRQESASTYAPPPPLAQHSHGRAYPSIQHSPSSTKANNTADVVPGGAWLCRTKKFSKICDDVFKAIDTDHSGGVDETELYSGLLLIHLKLGMYLGPAACKPLARQKCNAVFTKMDIDQNGYLCQDEFRQVMMVLFGNVFLRVIAQWGMTITIVPLIAQQLTQYLLMAYTFVYSIISTMDERSYLANWLELAVEFVWNSVVLRSLPAPALLVLSEVGDCIAEVPASVWNTFPVALLSIVLGIIVVPWVIFKIDDFFQALVDRRTRKAQ